MPTAGENPLSITLRTKTQVMVLRDSKSSKMVQPPFEIFLVPTCIRVLTWSGTLIHLSSGFDFNPAGFHQSIMGSFHVLPY